MREVTAPHCGETRNYGKEMEARADREAGMLGWEPMGHFCPGIVHNNSAARPSGSTECSEYTASSLGKEDFEQLLRWLSWTRSHQTWAGNLAVPLVGQVTLEKPPRLPEFHRY